MSMSGLAGMLSAAGAPANGWLTHAARVVSHSPHSRTLRWARGPLGLSYVSIHEESDRLGAAVLSETCLFVVGTIHNADDLRQQHLGVSSRVEGSQDLAEGLLEWYLAKGLEPFTDLNGAFVLGIWDAREQQFHLMTDRLGLRKVYVAQVPQGLVFASEVKALLAHPQVSRAIDERALAHLLSMGHLLDDRTLYASIQLLRSGRRLTYAPRKRALTTEPYWQLRYTISQNRLSLTACADELAQRLTASVERRLDGVDRLGIPISGGLDSRTLLGMTRRLRPTEPIRTFTIGHAHAYDVVFGRRIARACRAHHRFLPLEPDFMARQGERFTWLTDGMVSLHNCWGMALTEAAPPACSRVFHGFLGDALNTSTNRFMKTAFRQTDPEAQAREAGQSYGNMVFSDQELAGLLRPSVYRAVAGAAAEDVARSVREAETDVLSDRLIWVEIQQRHLRYTSYMLAMIGSAVPISMPFADNDVVAFLTSTPPAYRLDKRLYRAMIRRHLPSLARIGMEDTSGLPIDAGWLRQRLHWRWEQFRERQLPRWTGGWYHPHDRIAYAHYNEWMRLQPTRGYLEETLARGEAYLEPWCDLAAVRRVLADHLAGTANAYRKVSALMTLVLWLEQVQKLPVATEESGVSCQAA